MSDENKKSKIIDSGDLRRWRTELPNIVDDMGLSVQAFRLYAHIKRVAGAQDDGRCWQSTKTLAVSCKMSTGKVVEAKQELVKHDLITLVRGDQKKSETDNIYINDIWAKNFAHFSPAPCSTSEHPVQQVNTPVQQVKQRSNPIKNTSNNNTPPACEAETIQPTAPVNSATLVKENQGKPNIPATPPIPSSAPPLPPATGAALPSEQWAGPDPAMMGFGRRRNPQQSATNAVINDLGMRDGEMTRLTDTVLDVYGWTAAVNLADDDTLLQKARTMATQLWKMNYKTEAEIGKLAADWRLHTGYDNPPQGNQLIQYASQRVGGLPAPVKKGDKTNGNGRNGSGAASNSRRGGRVLSDAERRQIAQTDATVKANQEYYQQQAMLHIDEEINF